MTQMMEVCVCGSCVCQRVAMTPATVSCAVMMVLRHTHGGGEERSIHSLIAGMVGGWVIFGDNNGINRQVCD